jgi:hypothetical protein
VKQLEVGRFYLRVLERQSDGFFVEDGKLLVVWVVKVTGFRQNPLLLDLSYDPA